MPPKNPAAILRQKKLSPKKRYGQNFLVNPQTAERIIALAGIDANDTILELGVGLGALTVPLAGQVKQVIGLEIDSGIMRWHNEEAILPANVTLLHQDIMKADFHALAKEAGGRLKIMANLPYSISNPLLFKLIENQEDIEWAVLMLQKEVGDRIISGPGSKSYGVLSVLMAAHASVKRLIKIGANQFHPRPKVDSMVIKLTFSPRPERSVALPGFDGRLLKKIVNAAFQQRRKTLLNALSSSKLFPSDKEQLAAGISRAGFSPGIRGEKLSLEDFVRLTNVLVDMHDPSPNSP